MGGHNTTTNYHRVHHVVMQSGGPELLNILETNFRSGEVGHPRDLVELTMVDLPSPSMVLILEALLLTNPPTDINCMQFWSRRDKLVVNWDQETWRPSGHLGTE